MKKISSRRRNKSQGEGGQGVKRRGQSSFFSFSILLLFFISTLIFTSANAYSLTLQDIDGNGATSNGTYILFRASTVSVNFICQAGTSSYDDQVYFSIDWATVANGQSIDTYIGTAANCGGMYIYIYIPTQLSTGFTYIPTYLPTGVGVGQSFQLDVSQALWNAYGRQVDRQADPSVYISTLPTHIYLPSIFPYRYLKLARPTLLSRHSPSGQQL